MAVFAGLMVNDTSSLGRLYWHTRSFIIVIVQLRVCTWDFAATSLQSASELTIVSVFYLSV